jgi:hypothetical protein
MIFRKQKMPGRKGPGKLRVKLHETCNCAEASAQEF